MISGAVRNLQDPEVVTLRPKVLNQSILYALYGRAGLLPTIRTSRATLDRGFQNMERLARRLKSEEAAND